MHFNFGAGQCRGARGFEVSILRVRLQAGAGGVSRREGDGGAFPAIATTPTTAALVNTLGLLLSRVLVQDGLCSK